MVSFFVPLVTRIVQIMQGVDGVFEKTMAWLKGTQPTFLVSLTIRSDRAIQRDLTNRLL